MQENAAKCVNVMKSRNVGEVKNVLQRGDVMMNMNNDIYYGGDLSAIFQILRSEGVVNNKKRDRDYYEDKIHPAKRVTFVISD